MARVIRPYDYLLDANTGWRNLPLTLGRGITLANGRIELATLNATLPIRTEPRGTFGRLTLPRGVAVWNKDPVDPQIFMLDQANHQVLWWRVCCGLKPIPNLGGQMTPLPAPGDPCGEDWQPQPNFNPRQFNAPTGLAVSGRDLFVVDSDRLLVFTLPGFALRQIIRMEAWQPVDVALCSRTAYVLDARPAAPRVWKLDRQGQSARYYPGTLPAGFVPLRLQVDAQGRAYVVGTRAAQPAVVVFDSYGILLSGQALTEALKGIGDALAKSPLSVDPQGVLLLESPDQCPRPPLVTGILIDQNGNIAETDIFVIHRLPKAIFSQSGLFMTALEPPSLLDSGQVGNPWHRVVLELEIPDRTRINLFSFTSDVPRLDLDASGLLSEPPTLGNWQAAADNADEWLIQSPPGRYLYLALVLKGPGDRTPAVERMYLYAHRQSSLRFLPAVFQEDEISRSLLDRMLSLFDTLFGEIEDQIEQFPLLMDIAGAPADFLPWMASWFDLTLEADWTDDQRRAALRSVIDLYAWRGTARGLRLLLQLHAKLSDPQPRIIEHFRATDDPAMQRWFGEPGADGEFHDPPDAANHFSVILPARVMNTPEKRLVLRRLIDANKPAHTHYTLRPVYPGVWLGGSKTRASVLGVDAVLGSPQPMRLLDENAEPQPVAALVLPDDRIPAGRLGRALINRARLGHE